MKKKIITYFIAVVIELGIILLVCGLRGLLTENSLPQQDVVRFLCDAFFIAGIAYLCLGALTWVSSKGMFDSLGYAMSLKINMFTDNRRDWKKKETYEEYKERKFEKKKGKNINHLVIIGGIVTTVSIILFLVYKFAF